MQCKSTRKPQTQEEIVARQAARDPAITCETVWYQCGDVPLAIDVYRPNAEKYPGMRPGILFFFGGGFHVGTRLAFREQAEICAKQGYVALSADYRISSLYQVTSADSIRDGAAAWNFVQANAARWLLDINRTVLAGGSAGGTIAAMCGPLTGVQPAGLALFNPGILDKNDPDSLLSRLTDWTVDGVPLPNTGNVPLGMPPTLILHGEEDELVPSETVRRFAARAAAQGCRVKLIGYPHVGHGFFNFNRSRAHFLLTMGETLLFLNEVTNPASAQ